jgi:hypothetical protein
MTNPLVDVAMAAANLKAAAPDHFKTFCETLRVYEIQSITEMLASDGSDVFRAQGKVKTIQSLRRHIAECYELRETYTKRGNNA